jgi:glycosyltransferase involved in cell wall biosynthesis
MGLRVAYISDQKYYRHEGNWYTTGSFDLGFFFGQIDVEEWSFWGRLYDTENPANLFLILGKNENGAVRFLGSWNQAKGPLGYAKGILEVLKRIKAVVRKNDIVWLKLPFLYSILAARYCSKNQVVIAHQVGDGEITLASMYPNARILGKVIAYLCRKVAREADIPVYVSRQLAAKYAPKAPTALICNESRITEQMILDRPQAVSGPWKAIYVGRLSPEKNVDDLVRALEYAPGVDLVIVGDGPEKEKLEILASQLDAIGRVTWLGAIPWGERLFSVVRGCQAFVLASSSEGFPLVLAEAMSQGLPVVATNVGGIPELVRHEHNGLLVPVHRPDEIGRALNLMKTRPEWRIDLAFSAIEQSKEHTIKRQMGPLMEQILKSARAKTDVSA